jgi:hypothetical protein
MDQTTKSESSGEAADEAGDEQEPRGLAGAVAERRERRKKGTPICNITIACFFECEDQCRLVCIDARFAGMKNV